MRFLKLFNPVLGLKIISNNFDLLLQLVKRNISSRYKGSTLGVLWGLVQPLMMLCVYTFVFSIIFKARWGINTDENKAAFAIIMLCGLAVFNIFTECVNGSCSLIINNPNYVKKVIFPLEILPVAFSLATTVLGLIWFFILFIGAAMLLNGLSWTMLLLPVTIIPLILTSCGLSLFVASLTVYLRDTPHFVGIITQMLFFMTPIIYPIEAVPEKYRWFLQFNPLSMIIEQTRCFFLYGKLPNFALCGVLFLISAVIFQLGLIWFIKTKRGFADVL
ncbi:ABC transporter permease [Lentisphaerota bacterium ZTH]|nr:ABC transporter permease [Lentisphaerota bacterium]WET06401.1 ABC transporter permease [Lentisphaerota bacterium ZTH]